MDIKKQLKDKQLTQVAVASEVGCSQMYLSLIFNHKRQIPAWMVMPLSKTLDIPAHELLEEFTNSRQ